MGERKGGGEGVLRKGKIICCKRSRVCMFIVSKGGGGGCVGGD